MYYAVSAVFFLFFAFIWTSKDIPNVIIKMCLTCLTCWGAIMALANYGVIHFR